MPPLSPPCYATADDREKATMCTGSYVRHAVFAIYMSDIRTASTLSKSLNLIATWRVLENGRVIGS